MRIFKYVLLASVTVAVVAAVWLYTLFYAPNVKTEEGGRYLYLPAGADFETVVDSLTATGVITRMNTFRRSAEFRRYNTSVKQGRYLLEDGMNNFDLVTRLRNGEQVPVRLTFSNIRTHNDLAAVIGSQIEADSISIMRFLTDESNYQADGFTRETIIVLFIPNTYEVYWNISPKSLYQRMLREYNIFWTDERRRAASDKNLSLVDVSIIASIIDEETNIAEEKPRMAGVYLNRLRLGMPLQACPTIRFALNDFTITRVLAEHTLVDSPYNTYRNRGLPPGPVRAASVEALLAVLNAEKHDFLFFSARADFSGAHHFSRTLAEHNKYAAEYQRELNRRRILR